MELDKLISWLKENNIPYEYSYDGRMRRIKLHHAGDQYLSAISGYGSYGGSDLIEIMGLLTPEEEQYDSVVGYLTAEDVQERIIKYIKEANGNDTIRTISENV